MEGEMRGINPFECAESGRDGRMRGINPFKCAESGLEGEMRGMPAPLFGRNKGVGVRKIGTQVLSADLTSLLSVTISYLFVKPFCDVYFLDRGALLPLTSPQRPLRGINAYIG
ncbi:hypothetical protein PBOR_14155 [Paenibacillus borealis]|uniref:Uncharacterized protein n=1 Tax=Paenibacillus borealis TaxID=160799 RepID=A0A089L912_PAEBO|nr:hypothetical protein PBOR_14155 [Paenibacillus borealis]